MKIIDFRAKYPFGSGRYRQQLLSLNMVSKLNSHALGKIKNDFKNQIKDWLVPEGSEEPIHNGLTIHAKVIRHNKRKFDAINMAIVVKWLEDILVEQGIVEDDRDDEIVLFPTEIDDSLDETMIEFKVFI
jgi:hypothetical protein